ncbi:MULTISPECIES: Qat anti-phage system associated protein QatB [unclassified Anaeromyxobacter]|uniref:Qat anti-phage system associated protein QatB n=1 Tax=unclassified Anaeromyxobacter TaxID=2620896 RepID=UPI0027E16632|nr:MULTISPECIES: Qat anti-phage system associated protein QatB [unclassified Anaeromyxobacter]
MGTSTSNPGPTGRPPLLPPWADPPGVPPSAPPEVPDPEAPPPDELGNPEQAPAFPGPTETNPTIAPAELPSWNSPRRLVSSMSSGRASGASGRDNVRRAVRGSVGAMGGARSASQSSFSGRSTAARFAGFLSAVTRDGVAGAARTLGIADFLGRSADVFLLRLADALAPAGALTEDAIARDAMDATLQELYDALDVEANGAEALARLTPAMMAEAVVSYVVNYIYERVLQALTAHIHATAASSSRVRQAERTARQYIEDAVRTDIDTTAFFGQGGAAFAARWDAGEGQRVIERLFTESFRVVEAGLQHGDRRRR